MATSDQAYPLGVRHVACVQICMVDPFRTGLFSKFESSLPIVLMMEVECCVKAKNNNK